MKYEVKMFLGGRVFVENVQANNAQQAREIAQNLNKYAKIVGTNVSFR